VEDASLEAVLNHTLEVNHSNFKQHVKVVEQNAPKIFRIGKNTAILACGDERFRTIIDNLNKRKNISKQIAEQLKNRKLSAYWSCHVARYNKRIEKMELTSYTYESGNVKIVKHDRDNIELDSFSPEMRDVFQKNVMIFYLADTEEKIKIIQFFFNEIDALYGHVAGGAPIIAKLDRNGFQWLLKPHAAHPQNFTGYSHKWMPERIETSQSSVYAWSYDTWTDVLELTFECDSKMLCMVSAWANGDIHNNSAGAGSCAFYMDLTLDDDAISVTQGEIGNSNLPASDYIYGVYNSNPILILEKGTHVLKLRLRAGDITNAIAHVNNRRLVVLKGFYQGGAS